MQKSKKQIFQRKKNNESRYSKNKRIYTKKSPNIQGKKDGKDLYNFLWEVIKYFKDILVYKATNKIELYSEEEIKDIKELADSENKQRLLNIIYSLSELENDIKWSSQKTIMFQTGIIKICSEVSKDTAPILEPAKVTKIEKVEKEEKIEKKEEAVKPEPKVETKVIQSSNSGVSDVWKKVVSSMKAGGKIRLFTALINTRAKEVNDLIWEIEFPNGLTDFNKRILDDVNNRNELTKEIFKITGKEITIRYKDLKNSSNQSAQANNSINPISDLGIDINIID